MQLYDATKLLSQTDINGKKPTLFISTTNRSSGKTTWFSRYLVKRFKKYGEKFMIFYRFSYELSDVADKFFKDIGSLFFPNDDMTQKMRAKGKYTELFLNEVSCGYAVALNDADGLKRYSHLFSDVARVLIDEFQSETNHYCSDEVRKFLSLIVTISRGQGKQVRYVPVYMIANFITLLNPYYIHLGIADKLSLKTNFYKGDGFVLEQSFYAEVASLQEENGVLRAFSDNVYSQAAREKIYLNDDETFIQEPEGKARYIATLIYDGQRYSVREYKDKGVLYCGATYDATFPKVLAITTDDMDVNIVSIKQHSFLVSMFKTYFQYGAFRFQNQACKSAIFKLLSL